MRPAAPRCGRTAPTGTIVAASPRAEGFGLRPYGSRRPMPRVVICVCTCARPRLLAHLLATLERLEPGGLDLAELALVVVDNRPDGTARAVCEAARPRLPFRLAYAEEPEPGISFARNRALAEAMAMGAELVAFVDDDDEPRPDWLRHLLRVHEETGAD